MISIPMEFKNEYIDWTDLSFGEKFGAVFEFLNNKPDIKTPVFVTDERCAAIIDDWAEGRGYGRNFASERMIVIPIPEYDGLGIA